MNQSTRPILVPIVESVLLLIVVLIPGWWTIDPPAEGDTGVLLKLYERRHWVLLTWVVVAFFADAIALLIAWSRRRIENLIDIDKNDRLEQLLDRVQVLANQS